MKREGQTFEMPQRSKIVEDLFTTQQQRDDDKKERVENLPLDVLRPFENHPFKVTQDEDFAKLVESIKENGVLIPAIARPKGDGYELIAGHRRKLAARLAGLETMPVLVREMSNEQAVIFMVDSNVQREHILPSEKAFAYKMKLDALNRQGQRSDLTSRPVGEKLSVDKMSDKTEDSSRQIHRYIRLTELIPQLLQLVDDGKIAFRPAVEISYLTKKQQTSLLSLMEAEQATPSLSQAQRLKALSGEGKLNDSTMLDVMRERKPNQKEQVRIPYDKVRAIIKRDMPTKELEVFILKAVEYYQKKLMRQKNRDAR